LHLPDPQVMQKVLREGPELLRCFDQPLQHRIRVDLEHPVVYLYRADNSPTPKTRYNAPFTPRCEGAML
jgi:hypothetical protein